MPVEMNSLEGFIQPPVLPLQALLLTAIPFIQAQQELFVLIRLFAANSNWDWGCLRPLKRAPLTKLPAQ